MNFKTLKCIEFFIFPLYNSVVSLYACVLPCKIGASSYKKRRSNFDRAIKCIFFPMMLTVCVKLELLWGDTLDFFEALYKISRVVEAATKGDLRHGRIRRRQHICRLLDSIIGNVVYRCLTDASDLSLFLSQDWRSAMAKAIADGIDELLKDDFIG